MEPLNSEEAVLTIGMYCTLTSHMHMVIWIVLKPKPFLTFK